LEGVVGDIRAGDLIQSINGQPVKTFADLLRVQNAAAGQPLSVGIVRSQQPKTIQLADYVYVTILAAPMTSNGVPITSISTEPATRNESVTVLTDGRLAKNYGPIFPNGVARGRYRVDLGRIVQIAEIRTWSHNLVGRRGAQNFILYGGIKPDELRSIAEVQAKPNGEFLGTSVRCKSGLGSYRWLVWETLPVTELGEHTAFQEFQVLSR
jgi:membrane-associated protease RseP (regulator of RpoE activity)